eukprot:7264899-Pyramimonas_sp.AAC.1
MPIAAAFDALNEAISGANARDLLETFSPASELERFVGDEDGLSTNWLEPELVRAKAGLSQRCG